MIITTTRRSVVLALPLLVGACAEESGSDLNNWTIERDMLSFRTMYGQSSGILDRIAELEAARFSSEYEVFVRHVRQLPASSDLALIYYEISQSNGHYFFATATSASGQCLQFVSDSSGERAESCSGIRPYSTRHAIDDRPIRDAAVVVLVQFKEGFLRSRLITILSPEQALGLSDETSLLAKIDLIFG